MKKSHQIAIGIVLVLMVWMALGLFKDDPKQTNTQTEKSNKLFLVEVIQSQVKEIPMVIQAVGNVRPWQHTTLSVEVEGKVEKIEVKDGQVVEAGDLLVTLEQNDKQAQLEKNQSLLRYQKSRYERSKTLAKKQFQSELDTEEAYAAMKSAEAAVQSSQMDLENTSIKAPFTGIFESRQVDVGDYLAVKGEVGQLIDNSQLIITVPIPQNTINQIKLDKLAQVQFATGESKSGIVHFKSALADAETRTFKVEVKVENSDWSILAGSSADVFITLDQRKAHYVSPAILVLNDKGEIGIKSVNTQDKVQFHPVTIINSDKDGVWLAGLPDSLQIITVGQAYAKTGSQVQTALKTNKQQAGL